MNKYLLFLLFPLHVFAQNKLDYSSFFNPSEKQLILSGDTSKLMRITQVTNEEDLKILSAISVDISPNDPLLPLLAKRMYMAVTHPLSSGVGIAAPQVGINRNAIWVQRFDKTGEPFEFYINPKIVWRSDLIQLGAEGCLSIPNKRDNVMRNYAIQITYNSLNGGTFTENIEGFTAVIFQHEIDHLYGILFPERVDNQNQTGFKKSEEKGKKLFYNSENAKRL